MRVALIEPFHTRLEADERAASSRRRYGWVVATGMGVFFWRISVSMLSWFGSRCCTRIYAIPEDSGMDFRSRLNASNPPAEAPTPTTGKAFDERCPVLFLLVNLAIRLHVI